MATMLRSLAHRNFRLFFIGQGMSLIGTWMQTTAMAWLVNRMTAPEGSNEGSPFWLTMIVFANQIPGLLLGPVSGVVTDRFRRRPILYITQMLMMFQAFALAWLAYSGLIQIWHLIALGGFLGVVSTFDVTARQAFLTQMVGGHKDDLANAIALNSSLFNGARLIGPALAGGLLAAGVREETCFLFNGISYLAVLGGLWAMRLHEIKPAVATRGWRTMVEGARYTFGSRPILAILLLVAVVSLVGTPYAALMPLFAVHNLRGGAGMLGLLTAASGVGALAGALYMAARKTVLGLGRVIAAAPAGFGVGLIVFAFSTTLWLSLPALALMGFAVMTQMASCNTILQTIVDEDKRGRVMSFYATAFLGFAPIGALSGGALAEQFGATLVVAVGGVVCIIAALIFASQLPSIREHIRPIYRRIGILPEVAQGIQEASEPRAALVDQDLQTEKEGVDLVKN
jgi:MFS family permease